MLRLAGVLYSMIATSLAGVGVVAVLTSGGTTWPVLLMAAVAGAVLALPVTWWVASALYKS